ncbi:flagellar export chaperone FlgN [bacterium]|nr:flagellar export chaperone FlgN [bacterium]
METQFFENIAKMIDSAIKAYEELLELYLEKKQAILKPDKNMLGTVDEKIIAHVKLLTNINKERELYCKENGIETARITELIELTQKEYPDLKEVFEEQKVKIREVADKIALVEKTNVELIQHSLIMSDKLLDIIVSAAMPQKDNYDMHGKNIDTRELSIGSIVEEA